MKIKRILWVTFVLCLAVFALAACSQEPKYDELKLLRTEIVTCKSNSWGIEGVIDYENAGVQKTDAVTVNSAAENIAKFENGKLVFGDQYGETTVEIIVGNKKGTVHVKIAPYVEYLHSLAERDGASGFEKMDYYAASWLIGNLDSFKNPSSVSVSNVLYVEGTVGQTAFNAGYLIMELRAQNGFGGYNLSYYKVSAGSIEQVYVSSQGGLFKEYQGQSLFTGGAFSVNKAVQEYIAENY